MRTGTLENPEEILYTDALPQVFIEPYDIEFGDKFYWKQDGQVYVHIMQWIDIDAVRANCCVYLRQDEEV